MNFIIFFGGGGRGVFRKMKILWIFFWGQHKTGLVLGVISMHFRILSMYRMGIFFGVAKISNICLGMPDIPDIYIFFFGGGGGGR